MQKPNPGLGRRVVGRILLLVFEPEYRRLWIRSYVLVVRLELLRGFVAVMAPFAAPGTVRMVRDWVDRLRQDVAQFGRRARTPQIRLPYPQAMPEVSTPSEFRNPWA